MNGPTSFTRRPVESVGVELDGMGSGEARKSGIWCTDEFGFSHPPHEMSIWEMVKILRVRACSQVEVQILTSLLYSITIIT